MKGYVWYSFSSDVTGSLLADALGFDHGKKTPSFADYEVVLGWGCKPGKNYNPEVLQKLIAEGKIRVLNHVEAVDQNRDKLAALEKLRNAGVPIPGLVNLAAAENMKIATVKGALKDGVLDFPFIAHSRTNRGHPHWCYTLEDFERIVRKKEGGGLDYARSFCPGREYRVHIFRDGAIYAQSKHLQGNPVEACAADLLAKLEKVRQKEGAKPPGKLPGPEVTEWIVQQLAEEMLRGPNHLQHSVNRGWDLRPVGIKYLTEATLTEAIRAVDAAGLDFGAVSMNIPDEVKTPQVTNVTTAPALSKESLPHYVNAIREFCGEKEPKARKKLEAKGEKPSRELLTRLARRIKDLTKAEAEEVLQALEE